VEKLLAKKTFEKGNTIVQEGTESYNVYIITRGEAEVRKSYFGKDVCVNILKKGDVFGAIALIAKSPRCATVVAKTDLEVNMMYRDDFLRILDKLPEEVRVIVKGVVDELAGAYDLCAELAVLSKQMLHMKDRLKSLNKESIKEYLSQTPEIIQTMFLSLDHNLTSMVHNYFNLAEQLDKTVVEIDSLFSQDFGQKS